MKKIALGFSSVSLAMLVTIGGCDEDIDVTPAPSDAATTDATGDSATPTGDASGDAGKVCAPQAIPATFAPAWKPPIGFNQKKCTPTQIATLASCVWTHPGRDQAACDAFFNSSANDDCKACGYTTTAGTTLGAIVSNETSVQVNYAGCIAIVTGDLSANGCGAKVQANELCLDQACVDACPVPSGDSAAFDRFLKCQTDAANGVCKTYSDAAKCKDAAIGDGGSAPICAPVVNDFGERVAYYLNLFCGGTSDAGTDG